MVVPSQACLPAGLVSVKDEDFGTSIVCHCTEVLPQISLTCSTQRQVISPLTEEEGLKGSKRLDLSLFLQGSLTGWGQSSSWFVSWHGMFKVLILQLAIVDLRSNLSSSLRSA